MGGEEDRVVRRTATAPRAEPSRAAGTRYLRLGEVFVRLQQVAGEEGLGGPHAAEEAVGAQQRRGQRPAAAGAAGTGSPRHSHAGQGPGRGRAGSAVWPRDRPVSPWCPRRRPRSPPAGATSLRARPRAAALQAHSPPGGGVPTTRLLIGWNRLPQESRPMGRGGRGGKAWREKSTCAQRGAGRRCWRGALGKGRGGPKLPRLVPPHEIFLGRISAKSLHLLCRSCVAWPRLLQLL